MPCRVLIGRRRIRGPTRYYDASVSFFFFFFLLLSPAYPRAHAWAHAVIPATLAVGVVVLKSRSCLRNKLILIHAEKTHITGWSRRTLAKLLIRMAWQVPCSCLFLIKSRDREAGEARNGQASVKDEMEIEHRENQETDMINSKIEQLHRQKYSRCILLLEIYWCMSDIFDVP